MQKKVDHDKNEVSVSTFVENTPDKVFQAWSKPELMGQWMGPGPVICKNVDINLAVDGEFRIEMESPEGKHTAYGKYLAIIPNEKLHFTWQWEEGVFRNSEVKVEFTEKNQGTQVQLTHYLLPDNESRNKHSDGWVGCLEKMDQFLKS